MREMREFIISKDILNENITYNLFDKDGKKLFNEFIFNDFKRDLDFDCYLAYSKDSETIVIISYKGNEIGRMEHDCKYIDKDNVSSFLDKLFVNFKKSEKTFVDTLKKMEFPNEFLLDNDVKVYLKNGLKNRIRKLKLEAARKNLDVAKIDVFGRKVLQNYDNFLNKVEKSEKSEKNKEPKFTLEDILPTDENLKKIKREEKMKQANKIAKPLKVPKQMGKV